MAAVSTKSQYVDYQALLEEVNVIDTAEHLGLGIKSRYSRYSIECPFHKKILGKYDYHIGNCVVSDDKKKCHCFSCGGSGNSIDIVKAYLDIGFYEATIYLAQTFAPYLLENAEYIKPACNISKKQLQALGFDLSPIQVPKNASDTKYYFVKDGLKPKEIITHGPHGEAILCSLETNPIFDLMRDDPEMFCTLALGQGSARKKHLESCIRSIRKELPFGEMHNVMISEIEKEIKNLLNAEDAVFEFASSLNK